VAGNSAASLPEETDMASMNDYISHTWKIKDWSCMPNDNAPVRENLFAKNSSVVTITQCGSQQECDLIWQNANDQASCIHNVPLVEGVLLASSCTVQDGPTDSFNCPVSFPIVGGQLTGFFNEVPCGDGNTGTFTAEANSSMEDEGAQEHRHPLDRVTVA
jgi:hypothetical protein